jgi:3-oxoacyl-ACP reductase-like protein
LKEVNTSNTHITNFDNLNVDIEKVVIIQGVSEVLT